MTEHPTLEEKLDQILDTARAARRAVNVRTLAFVAILIILTIIQTIQLRQGHDIKAIATSTNNNSRAIQSATSPEAAKANADKVAGYLAQLSVESDCRSRRQQARMPAPELGKPCAAQTPADVYPGVAGQPARG